MADKKGLFAARKEAKAHYFKRIEMRIIPKGCMRSHYQDSWGDYWVDENGTLQIRAVEFSIRMFSYYVLLHEFMEAIRCYRDGVSLESIEKWDADHSDHDDPGCIKGAPYHTQHIDSMTLERIACAQDGYEWDDYDEATPV